MALTPEQIKHNEAEAKKKQEAAHKQHEASKSQRTGSGGATVAGAVSTYSGQSIPAQPFDPKEHAFDFDEVKGFVGDIHRGELAHIELDEEGTPTGAAFRDIPEGDQVTASVYGTPMVQFDELVTPSGAPITRHMNPEPKLWDAGMLARNPPVKQDSSRPRGPVGGGVINQPVSA
jgi:hypothetical protein